MYKAIIIALLVSICFGVDTINRVEEYGHDHDRHFEDLLSEFGLAESERMSISAFDSFLDRFNKTCLLNENVFQNLITNSTEYLTEEEFQNASLVVALYLKGNNSYSCGQVSGQDLLSNAQEILFGEGEVCRSDIASLIETIYEAGNFEPNQTSNNCFSSGEILSHCTNDASTIRASVANLIIFMYQRRCLLPEPNYFVKNLIMFFNQDDGDSLNFQGFRSLLGRFKIGEIQTDDDHDHDHSSPDDQGHDHSDESHEDHDSNDGHDHENGEDHDHENQHLDKLFTSNFSKCYSTEELLEIAGCKRDTSGRLMLSSDDLVQICPAILQQYVRNACQQESATVTRSDSSYTDAQKYGYGTASVLIISLLAFGGLLLFPALESNIFILTKSFFIALGVGSLTGDAFLHIIPQVVGLHSHGEESDAHDHDHENEDKSYIYKLLVVLVGIYIFCLFENSMRLYNYLKGTNFSLHDHHHSEKSLQLNRSNNSDANQGKIKSISADVEGEIHDDEIKVPEEDEESETFRKKQTICCGATPLAVMILCGDMLHNFGDGLAVGVAFSSSATAGIATSIAIFCHELPHEFGDFAIYLNNGLSKYKALLFNYIAACCAFIGLYVGLGVGANEEARSWLLAIVAGMFLYIGLVDVLHEMTKEISHKQPITQFIIQNVGLWTGWSILLVIALYEDKIAQSING